MKSLLQWDGTQPPMIHSLTFPVYHISGEMARGWRVKNTEINFQKYADLNYAKL